MEFEHRSIEQLDALALATMHLRDHDEIVVYRPDGGIDTMRFIETGETTLETWGVGNETASFEVAVKEPLLHESFATLEAYAGRPTTAETRSGFAPRPPIEQQPAHEAMRDAIVTLAAARAEAISDTDRFEPCSRRSCEGGRTTMRCWCTEGGSSYTDIDGTTVRNRQKGTPDADCDRCDGTGQQEVRCYGCKGAGRELINPMVVVINNQTGQMAGLRFEVAQLLAAGDVAVAVVDGPPERTVGGQTKPAQVRIIADFSKLMQNLADQAGISIEDNAFYTYWGDEPIEAWASTFGNLLQPIHIDIDKPDRADWYESFTENVLHELQMSAFHKLRSDIYGVSITQDERPHIKQRAKDFDIEMNDDLTVRAFGLRIDAARSPHANLQELITTLGQYNYRLGFSYTGIATGETGPALYIVDSAGNLLSEITAGYEAAIVLESACRRVRAMVANNELC